MSGRQRVALRRDGSFDAFELCARQGVVEGTVDVTQLGRLADRLSLEGVGDGGVTVAWRIAGGTDALGRAALEVKLDGGVPMECQRCLGSFTWPVAQRTLLLLARDEREMARLDEDDEHEVVLAAAPLEVRTLVEDELLLTLPFAPRCARPECTGAVSDSGAAPMATSAFAALAGFRRDSDTKRGK
jgi:uncharacterized protein